VHRPLDRPLAPQGWKIHVSTCLDEAEDTIELVWRHCLDRRVAFKFLRDRNALLLANAKYADRGASGKAVTIYPGDEDELERVLNELGDELAGRRGPYILSDLRWGAGPLYVRWGGFAERYCTNDEGATVLAVTDDTGTLVPDRREPAFRVPPWVTLPPFLQPHLDARNRVTVTDLPYRVERALHFSNAGGLYVGTEIATGDTVVLKEARPYAGLDLDGSDAISRLRRERDMLRRLDGVVAVPGVREHLTIGEHEFLVLDYVDATALRRHMLRRYPLVVTEDANNPEALAAYTAWALDVCARVEEAVDALHVRGVVMGDLHPFNVLLRDDGGVVLLDFETAALVEEGRRQTMADPGFMAPSGTVGLDLDRYALACLRLFMFLPLTHLLAVDRSKAAHLADVIADVFGPPEWFLAEAVQTITGAGKGDAAWTPSAAMARGLDVDPQDWPGLRAALVGGIAASATPLREDRLFPGDIEQFASGGLNLAHGAAGVLHALAATGIAPDPRHEEWLLRRAVRPEPGDRLGFYDGLHGVAHVLDLLGHHTEAFKVLDICRAELAGKHDRLGLGLHGGLAGIGLNLLHFAAGGDLALAAEAVAVGELVADRLGPVEAVGEVSGGAHPRAGLMHGSSGPALLFLHLFEHTGETVWLDRAATALRQDLRRCVLRPDGSMEVNEGWRTMPYLAEGSIGIGLVLHRYLGHRADPELRAPAGAIALAATSAFYVEPGLFSGRAGIIAYLAATRNDAALLDRQLRNLTWHAMRYAGHLAFPGEELLRLSMDLATGSAGILLAAGAALHDRPVALPFLGGIETWVRHGAGLSTTTEKGDGRSGSA